MEYVTSKWDGAAHKQDPLQYLGRDKYGLWLWGPAGRRHGLGERDFFITEQDTVVLIPENSWWTCAWWIGHPQVELYVDICTPAQWADGRVTHVDLDLDVIRFLDGRAEIADKDEFEAHRVKYGYPQEVVDEANSAAQEVFAMVSRNAPPFDGIAAKDWAKEARVGEHP